MKTLLSFLVFTCMLLSTQAMAECTANRNAGIIITKPDSIYTNHNNGTVTDKQTGLMWQQCSLGRFTSPNVCTGTGTEFFSWQAALDAAATANTNTDYGYSDWRLPSVKELESLVEDACSSPAINATLFPTTANNIYRSSSPYVFLSSNAWFVNFVDGSLDVSPKANGANVRLVRGSN